MAQLGELEKILAAAKEIGENFQKELKDVQDENELLKIEIEELREKNKNLSEENKILSEENEKIYLEMTNLRNAKEEIKAANEIFSTNLNQLVKNLEDEHAKTMAQINQNLNAGLQTFVAEYVKKISGEHEDAENDVEENTELQTLEDFSDTEIIIEEGETALATAEDLKKQKMQYAAFFAEEAQVEKDDAGNAIKIKNLVDKRQD